MHIYIYIIAYVIYTHTFSSDFFSIMVAALQQIQSAEEQTNKNNKDNVTFRSRSAKEQRQNAGWPSTPGAQETMPGTLRSG